MFLREPTHILLVVLILILLFGAKRLPDSARALGRSLRIFQKEVKNGDVPSKTADGELTGDGENNKNSPTDGNRTE